MQELAPIVLFVYNRPWHTQQTVEALLKNNLANESRLFIFADGPKNDSDRIKTNKVRKYIDGISGFKKIQIIKRSKNVGLAESVISGVSKIISEYKRIIVLEDDIVVSQYFLNFMNDALNFYENNKLIFSISGYSYPIDILPGYDLDIYFSKRSSSWGWATWKDRWDKAVWSDDKFDKFLHCKSMQQNFNMAGEDLSPMLVKQIKGKLNSWAIRWAFTHFINSAYCIYPVKSMAKNIGTDGSGTNFRLKTSRYKVRLDISHRIINFSNSVRINEDIEKNIRRIVRPGFFTSILNRIKFLFS